MTAWLVGTLFATSLLMALVLALREPVRRWFVPGVAYALWILPAVRAVLPTFCTTVERVVTEPAGVVSVPAVRETAAAAPTMIDQLGGWTQVLTSAWLAGAIVMLAGGLTVYRAQRRAILAGSVQLARLDGIRIVRSERVGGPLALGIFDRLVVLPLDFDQRFSERQRCLALDHELAHHRSGDLVANLIAFVLLCLQWFNPLAWAAHAAFRFDQEAACDARVLDKADAGDRASYGAAIAKAASGRALLCAGALDRPSTLSRRLTIMTQLPNNHARRIGFLFIGASLAAGLPLTATRAVHYVDKVRPAVMASVLPAAAPVIPAAAVAAAQAPAAASSVPAEVAETAMENPDGTVTVAHGVTIDRGSVAYMSDDRIIINGKIKRLEELTAAERATLRTNVARSLKDVQRERAELPARLAEAKRELDRIKSGDFERELKENLTDLKRDLAEIDKNAAQLRAAGEDPEKLKADLQRDLREAEAVDVAKDIREAMVEFNPDQIVAEVREAEEQMVRLTAKLNQLDGKQ